MLNHSTNNADWKPISGYEGLYYISSLGDVYSTRRKQNMKTRITNKGYERVGLFKNGIQKGYSVHRLVAKEFVANKHNKPQVNHIDENKLNNNYTNLEWCTPRENSNHGTRPEIVRKQGINSRERFGTKVVGKSLRTGEVIHLKSYNHGEEFGFSKSCIRYCCLGKRKQHKGYTWEHMK